MCQFLSLYKVRLCSGGLFFVDSVRQCWNVDLGDDFWKLFVTLLIVRVQIQVLHLPDFFWLLPPVLIPMLSRADRALAEQFRIFQALVSGKDT